MLNTIDTVIAFAVIMTVLSLLITIVVQMVSSASSLRGKNLANALALTFQTIDPKIGEQAHSLAAQILRDPIFSDSLWRPKDRIQIVPDARTQALIDAERRLKEAEKQLAADPTDTHKQAAVKAAQRKVSTAKAGVRNTGSHAEPNETVGIFFPVEGRNRSWKRNSSWRNLPHHDPPAHRRCCP